MMDVNTVAESYPRIYRLRGKRILIKFGGNSLNGDGDMQRISKDIALLVSLGLRPIVVHGGGPNISQEMEARGLEVRKVGGLRVTDDQGIEVVKDVLTGINEEIVSSLEAVGLKAIGISGAEGHSIVSSKLPPVEENGERVDLGHVGQVERIDPSLISLLCASGFVPVVYPICQDEKGVEMNVNADTVAAHLAEAMGCEEMVMVTDVPGLMRENGKGDTLIPEVTLADLDGLVDQGVVSGGMVPKMEACRLAISKGVKAAHMVSGRTPNSILNQLLKGVNCGTTVKVS
ncbi:MAG: acetylglutamate kinase [Methanomassiliicoccales archaeon]